MTMDLGLPVSEDLWFSAAQPYVFPAYHIIERMARVHHWVVLEDCQFDRSTVQITLPGDARKPLVLTPSIKGSDRQKYNEAILDCLPAFIRKLRGTIAHRYAKCPPYTALKSEWEALADDMLTAVSLVELCEKTTAWLNGLLGLGCTVHRSTDLIPQRPRNPGEWVLAFGARLSASNYMQGLVGIQGYMRAQDIPAGCRLWAQDFHTKLATEWHAHPVSVLDYLFRFGPETLYNDLHIGLKGNIGTVQEVHREQLQNR